MMSYKYLQRIILLLSVLTVTISVRAQVNIPKDTPTMEFVMQLRVTLGQAYSLGNTSHGQRNVIPITGGSFEGPRIKGSILNGGADYQLSSREGSRTELEAIYSILTDDGIYIHVRNRGLIAMTTDEQGNSHTYFKAAPQFEAPVDSPYAWLNNALYVCQPDWSPSFKGIILNVWMVK